MKSSIMEVSTKENGKYKKLGEVTVFYPYLSELGIAVEPMKEDEEGFPIYEDPKVQYAYNAVCAQVKAQARNKLVTKTATLKDGAKIAETVEELLESGAGNTGEALAIIREMLAAFKAWLPSTGKTAAVQEAILNLASNRKGLMLQTMDKKEKFLGYLNRFAEQLSPEQAGKFERPLLALTEACEAGDALDDM
jgi:phosphoribosylformylglycinamidine (FGAM) synthase-like enzyme